MKKSIALLPLLVALGCNAREVVEIPFTTSLTGAKSAIVAIESELGLEVSAVDLARRPVPALPRLEHDATVPFFVEARAYLDTLKDLGVEVEGHLPPGEGGPLPLSTIDRRRDQICGVQDDASCTWRDGQLGPKLESFRSPAFPAASRCETFDAAVVHRIAEDTWATRFPIRAAVRMGNSALAIQVASRDQNGTEERLDQLYVISEQSLRPLHIEAPKLVDALNPPFRTAVSLGNAAVVVACPENQSELYLTRLDEAGEMQPITTAGLVPCPTLLSSFGDTLFAFYRPSDVYYLPPGAQTWLPLPSFSAEAIPTTFIASGPDEVAAVVGRSVSSGGFVVGYADLVAETSSPRGATMSRLEIPENSAFDPAFATIIGGEVYFAFGENLLGTYFFRGTSRDGWRLLTHRATQAIRALSSFQGLLLATGSYGPIVQIDPERPSVACPDAVIVPASIIEFLVDLGCGRYLLTGRTNLDPASTEPRDEPQSFTIATVSTK